MLLTDDQCRDHIRRNYGENPSKEQLEYHIWVNSWKHECFLNRSKMPTFYTEQENKDWIETLNRLVIVGKQMLEQLTQKT